MLQSSSIERSDYTRIAHEGLAVMNPIAPAQLDALVETLELPSGARVVDLGCGKGDLLRRIVTRYDVEATGVDVDPALLAELPPGVSAVAADAHAWLEGTTGFDLVASLGTSLTLGELAAAGRLVLYGQGYWRREPTPEYLEALGAVRDELEDLDGLIASGEALGLRPVRVETAAVEDFDRYEDAWAANGERYAAAHPDEPGVDAFLDWIRNGRRRYRELGGREILGFAVCLYAPTRPAAATL